uniref:Desaturase-1 n=1 Tax=Plutella xylostella TaxID=51655 RepID=A0A1L8D6I7_PLUXY
MGLTTTKENESKCIDSNNNLDHEKRLKQQNYDVMLPKNEYRFMKTIRRWERDVVGFETPLRWINIFLISTYHLVYALCVTYCFMHRIHIPLISYVHGLFFGWMAGFGVTGGVHRYWCHRSYKAKLPLQIILLVCYSMAGQNTIYEWVRDHRVHHKYSETSADPHNANRGFFFAHVGWLMMKKHPDVVRKGKVVDMSDIENDPLVRFHTKYFLFFKLAFCYVIPILISHYVFGDSWLMTIYTETVIRVLMSLHYTWSVNSFAHMWGNKPYDKSIMPVENWVVSLFALGEGWHNYHHTFPWDYKAAEFGNHMNATSYIIDIFAKIGWAYDLKKASPSLVHAVASRKGDLSIKRNVK